MLSNSRIVNSFVLKILLRLFRLLVSRWAASFHSNLTSIFNSISTFEKCYAKFISERKVWWRLWFQTLGSTGLIVQTMQLSLLLKWNDLDIKITGDLWRSWPWRSFQMTLQSTADTLQTSRRIVLSILFTHFRDKLC